MRFRRKDRTSPPQAGPEAGPQTQPQNPNDAMTPTEETNPTGPEPADGTSQTTGVPGAGGGPRDFSEVNDDEIGDYLDLGGLLLPPPPENLEVHLQVDEESGIVLAVLVAGEEGAVELRAFAASRTEDIWPEVRTALSAEVAELGGTADEVGGDFGTELVCQVPVTLEDGQEAVQISRVLGCSGPRWFLRATLLGLPAAEPDSAGEWEDLVRRCVVRRGAGAMPPGEPLELTIPAGAEQVDPEQVPPDPSGG